MSAEARTARGPSAGRGTDVVTWLAALRRTEAAVQAGHEPRRLWATGLHPLDTHLGGGLQAGDLALVAGAQGVGKTTLTMQVARNVVAAGGFVTYICYEHDPSVLAERLLALEAAIRAGERAASLEELRRALSHPTSGDDIGGWLGDLPGMTEALGAVAEYGERLRLVAARGDVTGLAQIWELVSEAPPGLLVVDYLQKVHVPGRASDEEHRVASVASQLKDLALEAEVPVLAVAAVERRALGHGRIRTHHLKGSVTLGYEADVVLVLQDKYDVVARQHLVYDPSAGAAHRRWLVCSIEKNRHGEDHLDLEFRKRLTHGLLDPVGRVVEEQLVDERLDPA